MLITPGANLLERILVIGAYGAGKTQAYWSILDHTPESVRLFVIDNDQSVERFVTSERFQPHSHRVTWHVPREWPEYIDSMDKWTRDMSPHDWLVIDNTTKARDDLHDYYARRVYDKSAADHFLDHQVGMKAAQARGETEWNSAFDADDYQAINKLYSRFLDLYLNAPGHVFLTANAKDVHFREKTKQDMQMYAAYGVKPDAQKVTGHACSTLLYLSKPAPSDYRISTVKDRQRQELTSAPVKEFALTYLVGVAGWQPA